MSDEKEISSSDKLLEILDNYLSSLSNLGATKKSNELEIGFGGEGKNYNISKTTFNNVINKLKSIGFVCENDEGD